jgi:hypothetical protein
MALTLHFHRPAPSGSARSVATRGRHAEKRAEADSDSVYRDDDYLDDHE